MAAEEGRRDPVGDKLITVTEDGPYVVSGGIPMSVQTMVPDEEGLSVGWREGEPYPVEETYLLCRCGKSGNKPYCDHTHLEIPFAGAETASREPFAAQAEEKTVGPRLELTDVRALCASARFCDRAGGVWDNTRASDNLEARMIAIEEVQNCPAGRLVIADREGKVLEPEFAPSLGLVEDVAEGVHGPIWVRGGIPVVAADGYAYEVRNRVTLCRCGRSSNKPFCDGSHVDP
jgi:CDGSH-type Zn-finger protein